MDAFSNALIFAANGAIADPTAAWMTVSSAPMSNWPPGPVAGGVAVGVVSIGVVSIGVMSMAGVTFGWGVGEGSACLLIEED
jgi:hypothetical protein